MPRRLPRLLPALLLGGALALGGAAAAGAVEPTVDLGDATAVDATGKAGDLAPVTAAIRSLQERAGLDLRVVYVSDFDDAAGDEDSGWADSEATHLALDDPKAILLAVAIDQRQFLVSVSGQSGLSDSQLTAAEDADLRPALVAADWAGAAVAYARALGDLATGENTGSAVATDGVGFDWAGAAPWLAPLAVLVLAGLIALVISLRQRWLRGRRP